MSGRFGQLEFDNLKQRIGSSSDLGFSLVLARSELGQENDEILFFIAGIIVSQPEPYFRFDL